MKRKILNKGMAALLFLSVTASSSVLPVYAEEMSAVTENPVRETTLYRLYNLNSGEYFYTANSSERDHLYNLGWKYEGIGWYAPESSSVPTTLYRLYNLNSGEYFYTANSSERDHLYNLGWKYEGIGWYAPESSSVPVYRLYNSNAGDHHYTMKTAERDHLKSAGWKDEGTAWYATAPGTSVSREEVYKSVYQPCVDHAREVLNQTFVSYDGWKDEGTAWYATAPGTSVSREEVYKSVYQPCVDHAREVLNQTFVSYEEDTGIGEITVTGGRAYYALEDLNGDGIPELAICNPYETIVQLFTASAHKPVFVLYGFQRGGSQYTGPNEFVFHGSSGAVYNAAGRFHLNAPGKGYTWDEYCFTEPHNDNWGDISAYFNTTGSDKKAESIRVSMDEYRRINLYNFRPSVLNLKPLEDF